MRSRSELGSSRTSHAQTMSAERSEGKRVHWIWPLLLLYALYALGFAWGLPSEFTSAVDSKVPHDPIAFVADHSNPQAASKYPAGHQLLLLPLYGLAFLCFKVTGNLQGLSATWPYGLRDPAAAFSVLIVLSRMVSAAMAVAVVASIWRIRLEGLDRTGRWSAAALLAGSGVFVYYARVGNFDMPYLFWWVLSFVFLWKHLFEDGSSRRRLILSAIFAGLSVAAKDQAIGLVLGSWLALVLVGRKRDRPWHERCLPGLYFAAFSALTYAVVAILPQPARWVEHLRFWLPSSGAARVYVMFDDTFPGYLALAWETVRRLSYVVSPAAVVLAVVGLVWLIRKGHRGQAVALILPALVYCALTIFSYRIVYERFVLPTAFPVAVLAGVGIAGTLTWLGGRGMGARFAGRAGLVLILVYQVATGFVPMTCVQMLDTKRALAGAISDFVPEGSAIAWRGKQRNFPNADVYEKYRLMVRANDPLLGRHVAHALHDFDGKPEYILAESPQPLQNRPEASLLGTWGPPDRLRRFIHVPCVIQEYYLYQLLETPKGRQRRPKGP